jgi:hypothetical protein
MGDAPFDFDDNISWLDVLAAIGVGVSTIAGACYIALWLVGIVA